MVRSQLRPFFGVLKSRLRDRRGATAIEYTLVVLPLSIMALGWFEVFAIFGAWMLMDNAVEDAARLISTGWHLSDGGKSKKDLREKICEPLVLMVCDDSLRVDMRSFPTFADVTPITVPAAVDGNGDYDLPSTAADTAPADGGAVGEVVVLRVYYKWDPFTPGLDLLAGNGGFGTIRLASATIFQNEDEFE